MKLGYGLIFKDCKSYEYRDYEKEPSKEDIIKAANEIAQEKVNGYNSRNRYSPFFQPRILADIKKIVAKEWDNEKRDWKRKGFKMELKKTKLVATYRDGARDVFISFVEK